MQRFGRRQIERPDLSGFGVKGGIVFAAKDVGETELAQHPSESLVIPRVFVLGLLPKMIVDVIQLGCAPFRMNSLREWPIRITGIPIGVQGPLRVWNADIKKAARPENTARFRKEMRHFFVKFEVLEYVLTVNGTDARVGKRPLFPKVKLEVGAEVKQIDVDPSWFTVGAATEIEFLFRTLQKRA